MTMFCYGSIPIIVTSGTPVIATEGAVHYRAGKSTSLKYFQQQFPVHLLEREDEFL